MSAGVPARHGGRRSASASRWSSRAASDSGSARPSGPPPVPSRGAGRPAPARFGRPAGSTSSRTNPGRTAAARLRTTGRRRRRHAPTSAGTGPGKHRARAVSMLAREPQAAPGSSRRGRASALSRARSHHRRRVDHLFDVVEHEQHAGDPGDGAAESRTRPDRDARRTFRVAAISGMTTLGVDQGAEVDQEDAVGETVEDRRRPRAIASRVFPMPPGPVRCQPRVADKR